MPRWFKPLVFVVCLLPLARLLWLGLHDQLTANPTQFLTRSTGTWTLVMLCATLSVTPLRKLSGWHALARIRRMLGLFVFAYACVHLLTYVWFDQWFDVAEIVRDVIKRPFIAMGMSAFVLLLPLAFTSTRAMTRRLGRRWQTLHRLVYPIACLAILHFWWERGSKNDLVEPVIYAGVVALLLGARVLSLLRSVALRSGVRRASGR